MEEKSLDSSSQKSKQNADPSRVKVCPLGGSVHVYTCAEDITGRGSGQQSRASQKEGLGKLGGPAVWVYEINAVGLVTAMRRTSAALNPTSSIFCANIAKPSATGGLIVCPRSVESTTRSGPTLRTLSK